MVVREDDDVVDDPRLLDLDRGRDEMEAVGAESRFTSVMILAAACAKRAGTADAVAGAPESSSPASSRLTTEFGSPWGRFVVAGSPKLDVSMSAVSYSSGGR